MALILELRDSRGGVARTRVRLDALPLTVGRGYGSDLVLDDPYVDATHARILLDESGTLVIEDQGSVNGLGTPGRPERLARIALVPGTDVRIGHTTIRVRDADEPVPAALPDAAAPVSRSPATPRGLGGTGGRLAVSAAAIVAVALLAWTESYTRTGGKDAIGVGLGFAVLVAGWAGTWAVAGRIVVHRFSFLAHFAVASAAALVMVLVMSMSEWAEFLFPNNPAMGPLTSAIFLLLLAAVVAGHLAAASAMPRARCWRAGIITSLVVLALGGVAVLFERETFSDVPTFSGGLKPFPAGLVPMGSVEDLARAAAELKAGVDELAAE